MINKYFIFILSLILFVSCSSAKESFVPDNGPKNIKFSPISGKAGDIVTITGDDFFSIEKMEEYKEFYDSGDYLYNKHIGLALFNAKIYYTYEENNNQLQIEGTEAIDFIEFGTDKIVCKVPKEAKSGKIWINGIYEAGLLDLHHPSEEEFIVYDESGDEVR